MGSLTNPATPLAQFYDSAIPLEPTQLRAGDSWNWIRQFLNYPSAICSLSYILNSPTGRFVFPAGSITPDASGVAFLIQLSPTETASVAPGTYDFIAVLTDASATPPQQVTLALQSVTVLANIAGATAGVDTRSFIKKTLDTIEAAISGNTRPDIQQYMVNGREIHKISPIELEKLRATYREMYKAEMRAAGMYTAPRGIGFRIRGSR